jgi:hypothetical protein
MADQRDNPTSRRQALGALAILGGGLAAGAVSPIGAQAKLVGAPRPVQLHADTLGLTAADAATPRAVSEALALGTAGRKAEAVTMLQDKVTTLMKLSMGTRNHDLATLVKVKQVLNDARTRIETTMQQASTGALKPDAVRLTLTQVCEDAIEGFAILKA